MSRVDIRALLANPAAKRRLMVGVIVATQAREGITTTVEQAEAAYDKTQAARAVVFHLALLAAILGGLVSRAVLQ